MLPRYDESIVGLHEVIFSFVALQNPHMPALANSQSKIHLDILMGRDETLDVADFFGGVLLLCWHV